MAFAVKRDPIVQPSVASHSPSRTSDPVLNLPCCWNAWRELLVCFGHALLSSVIHVGTIIGPEQAAIVQAVPAFAGAPDAWSLAS